MLKHTVFVLFVFALTASFPAVAALPGGKGFLTPEAAVAALVDAVDRDDTTEIIRILGPLGERLVNSGDPVADNTGRDRFVASYRTAHRLETLEGGRKALFVGSREWPMPIPLIVEDGSWYFDTAAGEQEILNRRIGRNELNVIEVLRAIAEAQYDYARMNPIGCGLHVYAKKFVSTPGKQDGLYWPPASSDDKMLSPLGPLIAAASAEGYRHTQGVRRTLPYHGYYYRILKRQGSHAPGGSREYVVNGVMSGGFAVVAYPARYGDSGVMSFMISQDGILYQKDLGPGTESKAMRLRAFDPDKSWTIYE